ncbi:drebrin-like a [Notolabrus celidotus]|uniref:drebrin-like a n=1 Tax=Notolabrus celidotus TaxID=1203425 RepID=UPI001490787C|nr:drebrin-like a [Notolabrus celidotus]
MYAFCRVQDPSSGLPKYVLINWTGEGVKDSRKGMCANHVSSMANFLKGAHVTINARGEEDVEPETILGKVGKASGANFNFHKRTEYKDAPRGPVGSVYRKISAMEEIQQINKDDFWSKAQRDEEVRQQEEKQRTELERQMRERERMELYQKQREEEEEREKEQQRLNQQDNDTRKTGISSAASVQKANEAKSLISQREFNPRDIFKQREQSFEANDRPSPAAYRPGKLQSPFFAQKSFERESPARPRSPPGPSAVQVLPMNPPSPVAPASPVLSYSPARAASPTLPETNGSPPLYRPHSLVPEVHSPVEPADAAYTEEEWSDEFDDDADEAPSGVTPVQDDLYEAPQPVVTEEDLYENIYQDTSRNEENNVQTGGEDIRARALYDYQAVDDTEITFDPDDIITGIDMVDEGWWRGFGPDGNYGMFPANYVELL